jgi:hypothetical protein
MYIFFKNDEIGKYFGGLETLTSPFVSPAVPLGSTPSERLDKDGQGISVDALGPGAD